MRVTRGAQVLVPVAILVQTEEESHGIYDLDAEKIHLGNYEWEALNEVHTEDLERFESAFAGGPTTILEEASVDGAASGSVSSRVSVALLCHDRKEDK